MVTKKKTTVKKTTSKRKPTAKKPKVVKVQSFKVSRNYPPFFSVKITKQTVYWSILLIVILLLQLWILNVQLDVIDVLDSINPIE
jgi:hypothetical protein